MRTKKFTGLVLITAYVLSLAFSLPVPVTAREVIASAQLNLMPVPASVQLQTGRLAITGSFNVAVRNYADDRLRAGIARMIRRLAGRTVLTMPADLAADESNATLLIQSEGPGDIAPSLTEDESYSLEVTDKQARLAAPTVVGALRGLEISRINRAFPGGVYSSTSGAITSQWKFSNGTSIPWRR
jgi:hexosaminidase